MAAISTRTISTKLALEGEAEYRAKIKNINAELGLYKSELEKVQAQYKNSANTLEARSSKQSALTNMLETLNKRHAEQAEMLEKAQKAQQRFAEEADSVRAKLEALKNSSSDTADEEKKLADELAAAEENMQKAANTVTTYQKQLNNTERDQAKLGDELARTDQYLAEAKGSTDKCASSIDKFGKEVEKAGDSTDTFSSKLKDGLSGAAQAAGASIVAAGTVAAAGVKLLNDIAESTEEYRAAQGKLNTAFEAAGYSTETAKAAYQDLFAVLGDTDNATESAQLLAQLAKSEEDIAKWGEIAAGVTGTFGDALPINSLIEAANETAKVGQVTGALADALNWVGISEDEFNERLSASADEAERTRLITETLSNAYENASDIFQKNNSVLMEANRAQAQLDDSMAKLGGAVEKVKTELTAEFAPALSDVANAFFGLAEGADGADAAFAQSIDNLIGKAADKLPELLEFGTDIIINVISGIANAAPQLAEGGVTVITSLTDGLISALPQLTDGVLTVITALTDGIISVLPQLAEAGAQLINGIVIGVASAAPELIPSAAEAVTQFLQAIVDNAPLLMDGALQLVTGLADGILEAIPILLEATPELIESLVESILDAVPRIIETGIKLLGSLVENLPGIIRTIVSVLPRIVSSISSTLLDHIPRIAKAGVDLLTALINDLPRIISEIVRALPQLIAGMVDALGAGVSKIEDVGASLVRGLWAGIQSLAGWLWDEISGWISSIWNSITDFSGGTRELQNNVRELTAAQEENAQQISKIEEASRAYGEQQQEAARKTETMTARVEDLQAEMEALEQSYQESYEASYESLSRQMGLFEDLDAKADASISDMIDSLTRQAEAMDEYAANIQKAMELGVDQGLVKKLSDGSEESAKILAEIVASGETEIAALNEEFRKVEQGKEDFSRTIAELEEDFSKKMDDVNRELNDTIAELDQHEAARNAGKNNIQGLIDGTLGMTGALVGAYALMGQRAVDAYKKEVDQHSPSKKFEQAGRYDILGIIQGAEEEKARLEAAYEEAAQAALRGMARHLPSHVDVPDPSAELSRQAASIMRTTVEQWNGADPISIHIDKMEVRNDSDISRVAQELYYLTEQKRRSRGGGVL